MPRHVILRATAGSTAMEGTPKGESALDDIHKLVLGVD